MQAFLTEILLLIHTFGNFLCVMTHFIITLNFDSINFFSRDSERREKIFLSSSLQHSIHTGLSLSFSCNCTLYKKYFSGCWGLFLISFIACVYFHWVISFFKNTFWAQIKLFYKLKFSHSHVMACIIGICMQQMGGGHMLRTHSSIVFGYDDHPGTANLTTLSIHLVNGLPTFFLHSAGTQKVRQWFSLNLRL